jgi:hypothetical protein
VTQRTWKGEVTLAGALLELQANPILSSNLDCAIAQSRLHHCGAGSTLVLFKEAWRVNTTKRKYKRHKTTTPATVRAEGHTLAATTRDVSLGGLFIFTDAALREGSEIEVVLMLPKELGLPDSQMVCCHGKIVRSEMVDGQHGVAATIERFQSLPQA